MNGVPQGSVLGLILYILYVNELPNIVNNQDCDNPTHSNNSKLFPDNCKQCGSIPMYADDLMYLVTMKTRFEAQTKITKNLEKI